MGSQITGTFKGVLQWRAIYIYIYIYILFRDFQGLGFLKIRGAFLGLFVISSNKDEYLGVCIWGPLFKETTICRKVCKIINSGTSGMEEWKGTLNIPCYSVWFMGRGCWV